MRLHTICCGWLRESATLLQQKPTSSLLPLFTPRFCREFLASRPAHPAVSLHYAPGKRHYIVSRCRAGVANAYPTVGREAFLRLDTSRTRRSPKGEGGILVPIFVGRIFVIPSSSLPARRSPKGEGGIFVSIFVDPPASPAYIVAGRAERSCRGGGLLRPLL